MRPAKWLYQTMIQAWLFLLGTQAMAGVHYSKEVIGDLPSQWRGFLTDQKLLRQLGQKRLPGQPKSEFQKAYEADRDRLEKLVANRQAQPLDYADLGAILIRLGNPARAVDYLRQGDREFPLQYRILSNLATAWFLAGENDRAIELMRQVITLAPGKSQEAESLLLHWMTQTQKQFWKLPLEQYFQWGEKLLSPDRIGSAQMVGLWLTGDGRLLAQFANISVQTAQVDVALAMTEGCVTEFGIRDAGLLKLRVSLKQSGDSAPVKDRKVHEGHKSQITFQSLRPLKQENWNSELPMVSASDWNSLPWFVLSQTQVGRQGKPAYPEYLRQLAGKKVTLEGYMQPVGEDSESNLFLLLENPVGCWYCEMPALNGMVFVEMADEKQLRMSREQIRIRGMLQLRGDDPEKFLFTIQKALLD